MTMYIISPDGNFNEIDSISLRRISAKRDIITWADFTDNEEIDATFFAQSNADENTIADTIEYLVNDYIGNPEEIILEEVQKNMNETCGAFDYMFDMANTL